MENYICLNGLKTELTKEQLRELGFAFPKKFSDFTLAEIQEIVKKGTARQHFSVHDTKKAGDYELEIIGFDHDKRYDDHSAPTMTVMAKQVIGSQKMFNGNPSKRGWIDSDLRGRLNGDFFENLPDDLRSIIQPAAKQTRDNEGNVYVTNDWLFVPSESELFGSSIYSAYEEGPRYEAFATSKDRIRFDSDGDAIRYWTRSQYAGYTTSFVYVYGSGLVYYNSASNLYGAPLCFLIS